MVPLLCPLQVTFVEVRSSVRAFPAKEFPAIAIRERSRIDLTIRKATFRNNLKKIPSARRADLSFKENVVNDLPIGNKSISSKIREKPNYTVNTKKLKIVTFKKLNH